MTSPVGSIRVDVEAGFDDDDFERSLRAAVADVMADVQRDLARTALQIPVELGGDLQDQVARGIAEAQTYANTHAIRVPVDVDSDGAVTQMHAVHDLLEAAATPIRQQIDIQVNNESAAAAATAPGDRQLNWSVHLDADAARTELTALQSEDWRITVGADFDSAGLEAEINTALAAAGDKTVNVAAELDIDAAQVAVLEEIQAMVDKTINVKVDFDPAAPVITSTLREIRAAASRDVRINVEFGMSQAEFDRLQAVGPALRSLRTLTDTDVRIKIKLDMPEGEVARLQAIAPALRSIRGLTDKDVTIRINLQVDEAQLQRVAEALREIRSQTVRLNVDTNAGSAADDVDRLRSSLSGVTKGAAGIAGVTAAIAAITGVAGAAAGAVGGIAIAAAALAPAFAAGISTIVVGMQGVKDAFDAAADASENAPKEAEAQAKAVASATQQVTSAERAVRDAKRDSLGIEEDLTRARKEATDQLEDYHRSARRGVLDERQAARDLADAQRELAQTNPFDGRAREEAVDRVLRAQLDLEEVQDRNADNAAKLADAEKKGIDGSDQVVAVRERQAQADERLAAAETQLTQAQAALTEAQTAALPSTEKMNEALAKLSPNAQAFVLAARGLKDEWLEVRKAVQDNLFAGLDTTLTDLADTVLPHLRDGMGSVATQFNEGAKGFAGWLQSAEGTAGLDAAFAATTDLLRGMREGSDGFLDGLSQMMQATAPFAEQIGRAFGGIGSAIGDAFSRIAGSGLLDQVLDGFTAALNGLGPLLRDLLVTFAELGARVLPALQPLFESLGQALVSMAPALGDIGAVFARSLASLMPSLSSFITALAEGLEPVLPVLVVLLQSLFAAAEPLIKPLSDITVVVGQALIGAIQALAPSLGPLVSAFSSLVTAAAPLVPLIAENLSVLIQALAPALEQVFDALAPVIAAFAEQMRPVIEQIAPILSEVAMTIGLALADAIRQLAPVLPQIVQSFTDLLLALLPVMPELAKMAAQILPPLLNIFVQLTPFLIRAMDMLTWLVERVIIPLVIPYFRQMAENLSENLDRIGGALEWWWDTTQRVIGWVLDKWTTLKAAVSGIKDWFVEELFPAFGRGIDKLGAYFDSGVIAIGAAWDKLKEAAAVPIRFVVNQVWNNGLRKAWNVAAGFIPGLEPMEPVVLPFRKGGAVWGAGSGTSDSIDARLSRGEHVVTAAEVLRAGGQNILYAIRDMIARGVPFTWDNGRIITQLGRDNLSAYGAAVRSQGVGNVSPEGLFDPLLAFRTGGAVLPWMHQLAAGHKFARAQDGRDYQWAGPRWPGDSFDCSGLIGSTIAAILGDNPWRRYWATSAFAGYPARGAQGLVKNLREGVGALVGITDDPGGPGGGHTAGELRGIPELGIPAARIESGGAIGNVHYGRGTPVTDFDALYGLPIGANGFFQPSTGGSVGPSPEHQAGFVADRVREVFTTITGPIRDSILAAVGAPPPPWRSIPPQVLTTLEGKAVDFISGMVGGLGDLLPAAWEGAQSALAGIGSVADVLNPFRRQRGGPIPGTGSGDIVPALLEPGEIVMNRRASRVFGPMLLGLNRAVPRFQTGGEAGGVGALLGGIGIGSIPVHVTNFAELAAQTSGLPAAVQSGMEGAAPAFADATMGAVSQVGQQVVGDVGGAVTEALTNPPGSDTTVPDPNDPGARVSAADEQTHAMLDEQGRILSDTRDLIERTTSSAEAVMVQQMQAVRDEVLRVAGLLGADVLIPTVQSAMDAAIGVLQGWLDAGFSQVRAGTDQTTRAVYESAGNDPAAAAIPFGAPGSAFDATAAISEAVVSVADSATQAFQQVAQDVANAALQQRPSRVGNSRGVLGQDIDGGTLVNTIVNLTGVVIEIEDHLINTLDEIRQFRGDLVGSFDESGRLVSDTALLMQRNETSFEKALAEQSRINRELIKAVLRYLMTAVVIPIMTAILGAMIQLAVTAIGAAIGSIIPGIGTVIGAAIGAVVGAALAGVAAIFTSTLAVGAGAAIDAFDSGGVAVGKGLMVKDTALRERVLDPQETSSYDRLGAIADYLQGSNVRKTTVHAPIYMQGQRTDPERVQDRLLSLMPR
ncbi:hypothetical protein ACPESR_25325 [Nocardia testacea]|uniref:hypothetical protein n=1 Tax=Nocardia testacea TaxID=248551 RepID=UPI003C2DB2D7